MCEYFRDEGRDVLLFIDNIFRYVLAGSEMSALLGRMPSAVGSVVPFKTIQTCGDEVVRWVDVIEEGEPAWKMWVAPEPSPFVEVVEPPGPQLGATMKQLQEARQQAGAGAGRE